MPAEKYHPCSYMGQMISGKQDVKQMARKTVHVIVKHHLKTGIADGLIIAGIFSTNILDAKKVKETKLTKHKTSLYLIDTQTVYNFCKYKLSA